MGRLIDVDYLLGTYQAVCSAVSCEECRAKYKDGTCKLEHWLKAQPIIEEKERKKVRYIDSEELKHILNNSKYYGTKAGNAFADMIAECTSTEERKKGECEEEVFDELVIEQWQSARCSRCGKYHTTPFSYYFYRYNYCPNCGADMRDEENK